MSAILESEVKLQEKKKEKKFSNKIKTNSIHHFRVKL